MSSRSVTRSPSQRSPRAVTFGADPGAHCARAAQGGACPCPLCRAALTPAALFDEAALRGERAAAQHFPVFPEPMPISRKFEATLEMLNSAIRCVTGLGVHAVGDASSHVMRARSYVGGA